MSARIPGTGEYARVGPDQLLNNLVNDRTMGHQPKVEIPADLRSSLHNPAMQVPFSSRVYTAATYITAATATAEAGTRVYESPLAEKVGQAAKAAIPDFVKDGAQTVVNGAAAGAETVRDAAGSVFGKVGDYFGYARSAWAWGSWGCSFLPGSVKLVIAGAGIYGAISLYRFLRYSNGSCGSSSNTNTVHVNVNIPSPPPNCRPVTNTRKNANGEQEVQVGFECDNPAVAAAAAPVAKEPATIYPYTVKDLVRTKNKMDAAKEFHGSLVLLQDDLTAKKIELSDVRKQEIEDLVKTFNKLEAGGYVDKNLTTLVSKAGSTLAAVDKELTARDYHRRVTDIVKNRLGMLKDDDSHRHLKQDLGNLEARFNEFKVTQYAPNKGLRYTVKQAVGILAEADQEIAERDHTLKSESVHTWRRAMKNGGNNAFLSNN